jgi:UDP-glucose 4-epimerase
LLIHLSLTNFFTQVDGFLNQESIYFELEGNGNMILVTGGAGFIGSHLVDALSGKYDVVVVDDLSTGRLENLNDSKDRIKFHKMSLLDKDIKGVLKDVKVVFHQAAQVSVIKSVQDPFYDLKVNGKGILNLIENAKELERFIYASSGGAVYGEPEQIPVSEKHATNPISPYGVSKLIGEKYLHYYSHNYGLKTTSLRYSNVYGERQDPFGEAGVISIFINTVLSGEPPAIFGDGEQTRDYVHVSDVVMANLASLEGMVGTFNIGTGVETSVNHLVGILAEISGKNIEPVHLAERKGEVKRIALAVAKAEKVLGWSPEMSLKHGMKRTFEYLKENVV